MKEFEKNINGELNELPVYKVRPEKDQEILKAIDNLRVVGKGLARGSSTFYSLIYFNMKKFSSLLAAVVLVIGVVTYNAQTSFAHYLEEAHESLDALQAALADGEISDDEDVEGLIEDILENTEKAGEAAEDEDDFEALEDLHEEEIETFNKTAEVSDDEDLDEKASDAIESVEEEQADLAEERDEDEDEDEDDHEDEDGDDESDDHDDGEEDHDSSDDESEDDNEEEEDDGEDHKKDGASTPSEEDSEDESDSSDEELDD